MIEMKKYQADASRMWKLATKATYRSINYSCLAVREAFQNSLDAVTKAMEKGLIFRGRIEISYLEDNDAMVLTIADNGIGMVADGEVIDGCADLDDIYLNLGGTDKTDGTTLGGFGIGKAVILGCANSWDIHTRDIKACSDLLGKVDKWERIPSRQGTKITLNVNDGEWTDYSTMRRWLELSQWDDNHIDVYFTSETNHNAERIKPTIKITDNLRQWHYNDGITKATYTALPKDISSTYRTERKIIYRFNGLFQFEDYFWNHSFAALIDITTNAIPGDDNYPFDTSREAIRGDLREWVIKINQATENNDTAGETTDTYKATLYLIPSEITPDNIDSDEMGNNNIDIKPSPTNISFMVNIHKDYSGDITLTDIRLAQLRAWKIICEKIIDCIDSPIDYSFNVGFIFQDNVTAQYSSINGINYIMINPDYIKTIGRDNKLAMVRLVKTGSHEITHMITRASHNETFVTTHSALFDKALNIVNGLVKNGILKDMRR